MLKFLSIIDSNVGFSEDGANSRAFFREFHRMQGFSSLLRQGDVMSGHEVPWAGQAELLPDYQFLRAEDDSATEFEDGDKLGEIFSSDIRLICLVLIAVILVNHGGGGCLERANNLVK